MHSLEEKHCLDTVIKIVYTTANTTENIIVFRGNEILIYSFYE